MSAERRVTRVLVVEDEPVNNRLFEATLRKNGFDVTTVFDGELALDLVEKCEREGSPFDAIVMDVMLPRLSGLDATRALRDSGFDGRIVAVSALHDCRQECLDAGCDDFLGKPFPPAELLRALGLTDQVD